MNPAEGTGENRTILRSGINLYERYYAAMIFLPKGLSIR